MRKATAVLLVVLVVSALASTASAVIGVPGPTPGWAMMFKP